MPRKAAVNELQAEGAAASSPVRRSSRLVSGNGAPAGVTTRRSSQVVETDPPARATRGRRTSTASTQSNEDSSELKTTNATPTDDSQKETKAPARRGRKPSVTSESSDKDESKQSKPARGRRNSRANSEDNEEEKTSKTAPVRGRRGSANTEPDTEVKVVPKTPSRTTTRRRSSPTEEEKTSKTAPVRGRRGSANTEPDTEVKVVPKTPSRTTTRRRSSATENLLAEEVSTPTRRTRGKNATDLDDVFEETKKPVGRGRRRSVNQEEKEVESETKPAPRRGRRASTDNVTNAAPKTPGRSTRRSSITFETETKDTPQGTQQHNEEKGDDSPEVDIIPAALKEISVKVTPLKKRKLLEKVESELDLSIINESSDGMNISKSEVSFKETMENGNLEDTSDDNLVQTPDKRSLSPEVSKKNSESNELNKLTVIDGRNISTDRPQTPDNNEDLSLNKVSPTSRKRLRTDVGNQSPLRKSPRFSEKLSQKDTDAQSSPERLLPKENEKSPNHVISQNESTDVQSVPKILPKSPERSESVTPQKNFLHVEFEASPTKILRPPGVTPGKESKNQPEKITSNRSGHTPENDGVDEKMRGTESKKVTPRRSKNLLEMVGQQLSEGKSQASFVSSGSEGSFRFHLSSVSVSDSVHGSLQENAQENILNSSKESCGSNKENEEVNNSISTTNTFEKSPVIPLQEPIIVSRISNVFKPNQKECSFMEPMDVDESSMFDDSSVIFTKNPPKPTTNDSQDSSRNENDANEDSSMCVINNDVVANAYNGPAGRTSAERDISIQDHSIHIINKPKSNEDVYKPSCTETEGSDNLVIEETEETVNMSVKPSTRKSDVAFSVSNAKGSAESAENPDASLVMNDPIEKVKVFLSRNSSSPITTTRRRSRKSKSPLPDVISTDSELEDRAQLRITTPSRRSKSKSKTPSPLKSRTLNLQTQRRISKSKSPSPSRLANTEEDGDKRNAGQSESKNPTARSTLGDVNVEIEASAISQSTSRSSTPRKSLGHDNNPEIAVSSTPQPTSESRRKRYSRSPTFIVLSEIAPPLDDNNPENELTSRSRLESRKLYSKSSIDDDDDQEMSESKTPVFHKLSTLHGNRATRSKSRSPLLHSNATENVDKGKSSTTKSKESDATLEESVEKPKGSEEILVLNEQLEMSSNAEHLHENGNSTREAVEQKNNKKVSEDLNDEDNTNQDRTEYHTAIASTCNDTRFNSISHNENNLTQSELKHSESTHYDFDLPSDDDEDDGSKDISRRNSTDNMMLSEKGKSGEKHVEDIIASQSPKPPGAVNSNIGDADDDQISERRRSLKCNSYGPIDVTGCDSGTLKDSSCNDNLEGIENDSDVSASKKLLVTENPGSSKLTNGKVVEEPNNFAEEPPLSKISASPTSNKAVSCSSNSGLEKNGLDEDLQLKDSSSNETLEGVAKSTETSENASSKRRKSLSDGDTNRSDFSTSLVIDESKDDDKTVEVIGRKNNELSEENGLNRTEENVVTHKMSKKEKKVNIKLAEETKDDKSKSSKSRPSLDDFATAKLSNYIKSKAKDIEESSSEDDSEDESENEYNEFIDGMAEEGEEDTPSEDSNQIIDEGESIGSSDSTHGDSDDDYDPDDSFICEDEASELLSGEEYDLGNERKKKSKSRIIDPDTFGDVEIIKLPKKNVEKEKPKKKSRIIKMVDSSSDEDSVVESSKKEHKEEALGDEQKEESSVIALEESKDLSVTRNSTMEDSAASENVSNNKTTDEHAVEESSNIIMIEDSKVEEISTNESLLHKSVNTFETSLPESRRRSPLPIRDNNVDVMSNSSITEAEHSTTGGNNRISGSDIVFVEDSEIDEINKSESVLENKPSSVLNTSIQKRHRRSSLSIQENIVLDGVKDPMITKRINSLVESFCSTVKKGEISLNLSLEFEDLPESPAAKETDKTESVNILSDIKINLGAPSNVEQNEEKSSHSETEMELNTSKNQISDLREILTANRLKRRLSKSLSEIFEEEKKSKKRKTSKKVKTSASEEKLHKKGKKAKLNSDPLEDLKASSFGLMNQLVTDVKSRSRRIPKPTKIVSSADSSWIATKVPNLKPSTTAVSRDEMMKIPPRLHPKDFKNQLLSDPKRVKRTETKTLLKMKGAYV